MKTLLAISAACLLALAVPHAILAAEPPQAPASGFRAEALNEIDGIGKRLVDLAERIPADNYTWRPGDGVRSVSEVFLHVAAANFNLPQMIGTPAPPGFTAKGFDTSTTEKAKVVDALKRSFDHLRQAVLNVADADADKPLKFFGRDSTYRGFLLFTTRHLAEHLGQAIAYARINDVTPPWTEEAQRRQQQQQRPPQ
jgi:uncharacterized damage-inducible protein DinB